jgi:hypothetical protein
MNWEQWLSANQYDVDFGNDTTDLMQQAYVAGLRMAHDLLDNGEPEDFHFIRWEVEKLIKESE